MDNGVRQYTAGTPEFRAIQAQYRPLEDSELTDNPLFPEYDALVATPTATAKYNWQADAADAFRVVATRQATLTTDDVYGELLRRGIKNPPDSRAMGIAVLRAREHGLIRDDGGKPVKSARSESHRRPIRRYISLIFGTNTPTTLPTRENEKELSVPKPPRARRQPKTEVSATAYWKSQEQGISQL